MTQPLSARSPVLLEQASAWAVRLAGDDMGEADYLALEAWLDQSPDHADALAEAEGLWAALQEDPAALDAALARSAPAIAPLPGPRRSVPARPPRWAWGAAAGLVAAAAVAVVMFGPALGTRETVYVTAPGEQRIVSLADGSTIAMNGASRLSVRLSGRERLVEMDDAEAAFDVARDVNRPFRVTVGQSRIEVLGTAFDVRRDDDSTEVRVSRGVVRVSDLADAGRNVRLTRGQAVTRLDAAPVLEVRDAPVTPAGWRSGRLVYEDRPLSEVAADLSRAYATPVRVSEDAGRLRFTGVLALEDQDATVRRLEAFLPVTASRRYGVIELSLR
ncbi:FecR family protein [Brevundimonas sp. GCM10030266]|uniref:FecR family protein n=1 Tax=Brevundimonas sp. GCM10030266 TaxID=3273386 RepID=UPI003623D6D4